MRKAFAFLDRFFPTDMLALVIDRKCESLTCKFAIIYSFKRSVA